MKTEKYTVLAVSLNTNSFGLKRLFLLSAEGCGRSLLKTPYGGDRLPREGDDVTLGGLGSYECLQELPNLDPKTAAKIIRTVKKKARLEIA